MEAVRLEGVPARVFIRSQDHQHELIRELTLIRFGASDVPQRLATLISGILDRYADVRAVTRDQAVAALNRGEETVTLDVPVRDGIAESLRTWLALLEEADHLSSAGAMLILAAEPDVQELRRWYVDQIVSRLQTGNVRHVPDDEGAADAQGRSGVDR